MVPVVEFENVSFAYRQNLLLQGVNFSIKRGEFVGMIGPNGSGKTTLLKMIMGFLSPTFGTVRLFGKKIDQTSHTIAYVPQSKQFDRQFPISVLELVLLGRLSSLPWYGKYSTSDKEAALKALNRVGLMDYQHKAFGTLSGGEAQRALIARALVSEPQLLLLDEPTANVDSKAEADIYHLLRELQGNMTILMVTHDLQTAIDHVGRVLCVQRNVVSLAPKEVCEHFALGLYHPPLVIK